MARNSVNSKVKKSKKRHYQRYFQKYSTKFKNILRIELNQLLSSRRKLKPR